MNPETRKALVNRVNMLTGKVDKELGTRLRDAETNLRRSQAVKDSVVKDIAAATCERDKIKEDLKKDKDNQ